MSVRTASPSTACPDCDLLQQVPPLPPRGQARCARCGCSLARRPYGPPELPLALTVTAVIAFLIANVSPLMDLSAVGRAASTTIVGGAYEMWLRDEKITGVLVAFCAVIAPGGFLSFMLTLLLAARRTPVPLWVGEMLRWGRHFEMWSMLEVMTLGILVALIKIATLASVEVGMGIFAVGALVLLFPAITLTFDEHELWQRVAWLDAVLPAPASGRIPVSGQPR